MFGAGRLDARLTFMRASTAVNAMNEPVDTWSALVTVWGNATPMTDGEKLRAGETLASIMTRFTVRYSAATAQIDPRDRISFRGATYDINGIKLIGRNQFFEISATARAEAA